MSTSQPPSAALLALLVPIAMVAMVALGACRSIDSPVPDANAWATEFAPPELLETERVRLEPLAPRHVALDYAALMCSQEHLRQTLHWGDWPRADFTVEENREDLVRHWGEFERHEAYAYTVLTPDGNRCVGCIYLNPASEDDPRAARLAFWVVEDQLASDLDRHLLDSVLGWIGERFPLDSVAIDAHDDNVRGARLLADAGLEERASPDPNHRTFVWRRSAR